MRTPTTVRLGAVSLDKERATLHGPTGRIDLRRKSFEVLQYLSDRPSRIVSKEELFGAIWPDVVVGDDSLAQCIYEIRRVLGPTGKEILKTLPRRGYIFDIPDALLCESADVEVAQLATSSSSLSSLPSIAVLPFANFSDDAEQQYFSDGLTEDIITELSRFSQLHVIARNSVFRYKGAMPDVRRVGSDLGVSYVLEGSVRRAADRVRITAQLVNTATGGHVWAERYDREIQDVFVIQDDVVASIVPILAARLTRAECERSLLRSSAILEAHDYYWRASSMYASFHQETAADSIVKARQFLDACLQADPCFARAHVLLSATKTTTYTLRSIPHEFFDPETLAAAHASARRAVNLMPELPEAHAQLGYTYSWMHEHNLAIAEFERSFALNSNFTDWRFCATLLYAGQADRGIDSARRHMRFDPFALPIAQGFLGFALLIAGRHEEAVRELQQFVARSGGHHGGRYWLIAAYANLGQLEAAREEAANLLRVRPDFSISSSAAGRFPFRSMSDRERFLGGLRRVGLAE